MVNKLQLILVNIFIIGTVACLLYFCSERTKKEHIERINAINKDYKYSEGLITDLKSYKGHSVEIKYKIGNKTYEGTSGWDKNPEFLKEGDSIKFRYSAEKPELIISELEDEY